MVGRIHSKVQGQPALTFTRGLPLTKHRSQDPVPAPLRSQRHIQGPRTLRTAGVVRNSSCRMYTQPSLLQKNQGCRTSHTARCSSANVRNVLGGRLWRTEQNIWCVRCVCLCHVSRDERPNQVRNQGPKRLVCTHTNTHAQFLRFIVHTARTGKVSLNLDPPPQKKIAFSRYSARSCTSHSQQARLSRTRLVTLG